MGRIDFFDNTDNYLRLIIIAMMKQEGRSFENCELCGAPTNGRPEIHHTKYDGATYYDLRITCSKCNHAPINVGLN